MEINAILFDLDGTLLPMDQDVFIAKYFEAISQKLSAYGYEPKKLIETVWQGTGKMVMNRSNKTNEEVFWSHFSGVYGEGCKDDIPYFDEFYENEFDKIKSCCGFNPRVRELISSLKVKGMRLILATNPVFPAIATNKRIAWSGLSENDFELVTTYENSTTCKPSLNYYEEILEKTGLIPEQTLMVGNDVTDDMVAEKLGINVFLLTDNLINKENIDISRYPHGDFDRLIEFTSNL